jgi:hypothetical protein
MSQQVVKMSHSIAWKSAMQLQGASTIGLAHFKKLEVHDGEVETQFVYRGKTAKKSGQRAYS